MSTRFDDNDACYRRRMHGLLPGFVVVRAADPPKAEVEHLDVEGVAAAHKAGFVVRECRCTKDCTGWKRGSMRLAETCDHNWGYGGQSTERCSRCGKQRPQPCSVCDPALDSKILCNRCKSMST